MPKFIIVAILISVPFILNACSEPSSPEPPTPYEECLDSGASQSICESKYGDQK